MRVSKCDNGCGRYSDTSPGTWVHVDAPMGFDYCPICAPLVLPAPMLPAALQAPLPATSTA
jgi:hypothetical protein